MSKRNFGFPGNDNQSVSYLGIVALGVLLLVIALGVAYARADSSPPTTCEEVVRRVGPLKPLWLAERIARKKYPQLTEEQISWGRRCVEEARKNSFR